jgi:hypothetical protein
MPFQQGVAGAEFGQNFVFGHRRCASLSVDSGGVGPKPASPIVKNLPRSA